jgi:hypothetical protein
MFANALLAAVVHAHNESAETRQGLLIDAVIFGLVLAFWLFGRLRSCASKARTATGQSAEEASRTNEADDHVDAAS